MKSEELKQRFIMFIAQNRVFILVYFLNASKKRKLVTVNVKVKPSRLLSACSFLPRATLRLPPVTYIGKPMCIAFQASFRHHIIILRFRSFPMIFPLSPNYLPSHCSGFNLAFSLYNLNCNTFSPPIEPSVWRVLTR